MSKLLEYIDKLKQESPTFYYVCSPSKGWPIVQISKNISSIGYDKSEFEHGKMGFQHLIYEEDIDRVTEEYEFALANKMDFVEFEYRMYKKNRELIWVKDKVIVEKDRRNQVKSLHGVLIDITEFKEQSAEVAVVRDIKKQYKVMLDKVAIVASTDRKGIINYANDKFYEISGYSEEEVIGSTHQLVNSGLHSKEFFKDMWATIGSGKIWKGEVCNRKKSGELYWVDTTIIPFKTNGKITHYMAIRFDVTERKLLEDKVEKEKQISKLSSQLALVGEMSTGIVHEINNPLTVAGLHIEQISKELQSKYLDKTKIQDSLFRMEEALKRISIISKNIRDLSHVDFSEGFEKVSLFKVVKDSVEMSLVKLQKNGVSVRIVNKLKDSDIYTKPVEMSQILINLISNACDALEKCPERHINVYLQENGVNFQILVEDSGKGVPVEIQDKIMEPFVTTKGKGKGTGVGLSLCSNLAKNLNGKIFLDKHAKKTTFVLEIPAYDCEAVA